MRAGLATGYSLIVISALFLVVGTYAILASAFLPTPTNLVRYLVSSYATYLHAHFLASQHACHRFTL